MNYPYFFNRLFLLSALILLLNACHKPDTTDTNEYVLKTVNYSYSARSFDDYEYNDKWQLIEHRNQFPIDSRNAAEKVIYYFYTTDGRVERTETAYYNIGFNWERTEYTYNIQGRPVLTKKYNKNTGKLMFTEEYTYNGQIITMTHFADTGKVYVSTYTFDDRGNIVKGVTDYINPVESDYTEEWLDYDDKKNLTGPAVGDVVSKNNYRKYIKQTAGQADEGMLFKHTYNNAGYVTESKSIDLKGGEIRSIMYTLIPKQ
jgi:hypothetical protein